MTRLIWRLCAVGGVAFALSACGNSASVTTPPPKINVASEFGTGFAATFAAPSNSVPQDPQDSDVIPLTLTAKPIPLH